MSHRLRKGKKNALLSFGLTEKGQNKEKIIVIYVAIPMTLDACYWAGLTQIT